MSVTTALIVTIIAIFLSGLFSGTEIAFVQSNKVRMEIDASRGGIADRIIKRFVRNGDMFISTLLVGNNIVLVVYGITFSILINRLLESWFPDSEALVLLCNTVISTSVILLLGEFMPKSTFRINPNVSMRLLAIPLYLIYIVLFPISKLVAWISRGLMFLFGIKDNENHNQALTIDQLDNYLQETMDSQKAETEVENEVKIFRNAIDFKDTQIGECMIPRNEIVAVPVEGTSRTQLVDLFISTGLSKIVVFNEDVDDIVGYIHISELFNSDSDWTSRLKPVIFTPETMLANKMMRRMLAEKKSLAIVVDEFGGTSGMVTLEDIVEEIFGEIEDEHDRKRTLGRRLADGSLEISGRAEIEYVNEEFGLDIKESEDYNTLAGYILENLETIPEEGDTFMIGDLKFTILKRSATRIELVGILPA